MYELIQKLLNDLELNMMGNFEIERKSQIGWRHKLVSCIQKLAFCNGSWKFCKRRFLALSEKRRFLLKVFWFWSICFGFLLFTNYFVTGFSPGSKGFKSGNFNKSFYFRINSNKRKRKKKKNIVFQKLEKLDFHKISILILLSFEGIS